MTSKEKLVIAKIGGNVINDENSLDIFLEEFSKIKSKKILVHGGGKIASEFASKIGIESKFIDGRRVTDSASLQVAVMSYAGWINKTITSKLNAMNCKTLGLSGADLKLIPSKKRDPYPIDFGFVGDILLEKIDSDSIKNLLLLSDALVFAPISSDIQANLLNINADTIASAISIALSQFFDVQLLFCFEKDGVLEVIDNKETVIKQLSNQKFELMKEQRTIHSGMIVKIENAIKAKNNNVSNVIICNSNNIANVINNNSKNFTQIIL